MSSGSSTTSTTTSGFLQNDVSRFLKQGNLMGAGNTSFKKPTMQSRTVVTEEFERVNPFDKNKKTRVLSDTGALGELSSMSTDQLNAIATAFTQRANEITERVTRPGRSVAIFGKN